jgi:hypothetical protein
VRLPWLQAAWLVIAPCSFVPGLMNPDLIAQICQAVDLPINVMFKAVLTACGVARISHSPGPYSSAMADLTARFAALGISSRGWRLWRYSCHPFLVDTFVSGKLALFLRDGIGNMLACQLMVISSMS